MGKGVATIKHVKAPHPPRVVDLPLLEALEEAVVRPHQRVAQHLDCLPLDALMCTYYSCNKPILSSVVPSTRTAVAPDDLQLVTRQPPIILHRILLRHATAEASFPGQGVLQIQDLLPRPLLPKTSVRPCRRRREMVAVEQEAAPPHHRGARAFPQPVPLRRTVASHELGRCLLLVVVVVLLLLLSSPGAVLQQVDQGCGGIGPYLGFPMRRRHQLRFGDVSKFLVFQASSIPVFPPLGCTQEAGHAATAYT